MRGRTRLFIVCGCLLPLSGCALRPAWLEIAADGQLQPGSVDTGRFRHLWLWNGVAGSHLRVYVEGDGTPWIRKHRVSIDPTPANPVLLRLMHDAGHPAVYLGRPCYFGRSTDSGCKERFWTFDRYGHVVVDSMCRAANDVARQVGAGTVQLIGYSGGGTIVLGMAACTERLVAVTTIAGNLDPVAWAKYHGYSPLGDVYLPSGAAGLAEHHWQCSADRIVPPAVTDAWFAARSGAERHVVESCTHATGWQAYWPEITAWSPAETAGSGAK